MLILGTLIKWVVRRISYFRVTTGQDHLGIDVQGGGIAAWRIDGALKSIGEGELVIEWSIQGRREGWLLADETSEPIR